MARMRAAERRRQLLEIAAGLFAQRGYSGTTTAALAEAAGITEPILYRHFENKLDLFVKLVQELGAQVLEAWRAALEDVDDPAKRLRILLAGNPATHERGREVYRVIFQAMTGAQVDPAIDAAIRQHVADLHRFLTTEVRRLQRLGTVRRDEPATALAWMLVSVAIGYGMIYPMRLTARGRSPGKTGMQRLIGDVLAP